MNLGVALKTGVPSKALSLEPVMHLPARCDELLAPAGHEDFFSSRLWYEALLAHATPAASDGNFLHLGAGTVLLPLLQDGSSLTSPYTIEWRPLLRLGVSATELRKCGMELARTRRFSAPMRWEAMDLEVPGTAAILAGAEEGGLAVLRFRHFGNWHETLDPGVTWPSYLAQRPSVLRSTIQRKLAKAARIFHFELVAAPGPALEVGIEAYEAVRAGSWKPAEPYPLFDRELMRRTASAGLLRLGILRESGTGEAVAAQYWVLGGRRAYLLKLCHLERSRAASPGTALTALMVRHLIEVDGSRELDFGRGDDDYKQLWVKERRQRHGVLLASPWHPLGMMAIARHRASSWLRARRGAR